MSVNYRSWLKVLMVYGIWYTILTSTSFLVQMENRRWGNERSAKKDRDFCKFIRLPATTNFYRTRMRPPNPLWRLFISSAPDLSSNLRSRAHASTERFRSLPSPLYHAIYTNLSSVEPSSCGQFLVFSW